MKQQQKAQLIATFIFLVIVSIVGYWWIQLNSAVTIDSDLPTSVPYVGNPSSSPISDPLDPFVTEDGFIYRDAIIDKVEIIILESFPVQVRADITGQLNDGCTSLDDVAVTYADTVFTIDATTQRPADGFCTQALRPFSESVELGVLGLKAGTYTVIVNDFQTSFTLDIDNSL